MDEEEPRALRPQQVAISERPDRRRMETGRTADPTPGKPGGGKRTVVVMREVVNGLHVHSLDRLSVARDPEKTCRRKAQSTTTSICGPMTAHWERIHHALYEQCREQAQREASPTAAIIDSQSVKSAEKGGPALIPHGYDAGKKIKGKKRHILVDTLGLLLHAIVHPADHSRSRWRHSRHVVFPVRDVSLFEDALRRRRISRTAICESAGKLYRISTLKSPCTRSDRVSGFVVLAQTLDRRGAPSLGSIAAEGSP